MYLHKLKRTDCFVPRSDGSNIVFPSPKNLQEDSAVYLARLLKYQLFYKFSEPCIAAPRGSVQECDATEV